MTKITSQTHLELKPNVHRHLWIFVCLWSSCSSTLQLFTFTRKFPLQSKQALFFHAFNKFCRNCTSSSAILAPVLACSSSELTSEAMNILDNW